MEVQTGVIWRIPLIEPSMCGTDAACCEITLSTCYYYYVPILYRLFVFEMHRDIGRKSQISLPHPCFIATVLEFHQGLWY